MKLSVYSIGDPKSPWVREGESEYIKRIGHYARLEIKSVRGEKVTAARSEEEIRETESKRLTEAVPPTAFLVVLDPTGKELPSEALAELIRDHQNRSTQELAFCIGGPLGLDAAIRKHADLVLSLSKMTLPHELCRLVFFEQIYRAFTILRGEKYHK